MSAKATEYYTREQDTKGTARMVLFILAEHANEEGYCYPGIPLIAKKCNRSERAIQMALKALQEAGKIGIQYNHGKNTYHGKTNMFYLNDYRVSLGLEPVVTKSPYKSKDKPAPKFSPREISSTQEVKISAVRGEISCTQNKYTNQNLLNNYKHNGNVKIQFGKLKQFENQNESAMHDQRPTDNQSAGDIKLTAVEQQPEIISSTTQFENQSAKAIELPTVEQQPEVISSSTQFCGDKEFSFKEKPVDLIFPIQMSKLEKQEITNLLIKQHIKNESWQDLIDTLAYQMKQKAIASKAGYFVGILKKFKSGEFTTGEAQKIQSKRQPKQTSADDLKNKVEKLAEKNRKPVIDEKTAKVIEIINSIETKAELQKIYPKLLRECPSELVMKTWSKRIREVRA